VSTDTAFANLRGANDADGIQQAIFELVNLQPQQVLDDLIELLLTLLRNERMAALIRAHSKFLRI
jgi:hypothetical protein